MAGATDTGAEPQPPVTAQQVTGPTTSASPARGDEITLADLMRQLSDQTTRLVHQEIELAKVELTEKGKRAGIGAGMFGGAGVFGLYAVGALTATAILALSLAVASWLAALIVTAVLGAVAGVLALQGKTKIKQATPPVPERATASTKEDVRWVKTRAQDARR